MPQGLRSLVAAVKKMVLKKLTTKTNWPAKRMKAAMLVQVLRPCSPWMKVYW